MATYVVGDVQGCFDSLIELLDKIQFKWDRDQLWICGDIVNRGPQSLLTLEYIYQHRDNIQIVLGNHDLHMLAVGSGKQSIKRKDTFEAITEQKEHKHLLKWLRKQPLAFYSEDYKTLMVHAGISCQWDLAQTLAYSSEMHVVLKDKQLRKYFFKRMYGNEPSMWSEGLEDIERWRYITNAFTRMRFVYPDGRLEMGVKVGPGKQPQPLLPWYELPLSLEKDIQIVFGHWAALNGKLQTERFQSLDTGCVWGGSLTAYNLDTQERISVQSRDESSHE